MVVEAVNNSSVKAIQNHVNFCGGSDGSLKDKKTIINASNLILGSLAAVGVLSAADILICKGKHLNKLIKKINAVKPFDPSKFDKAAFDAKIDRTLPANLDARMEKLGFTKGNNSFYLPDRNGIDRRLHFDNDGKIKSIEYFDYKHNIRKVEDIATHRKQEVWDVRGTNERIMGRIFNEGDVVKETYYYGTNDKSCPFLDTISNEMKTRNASWGTYPIK